MVDSFQTFLSQLTETNATLDYFVDFHKIKRNVHSVAIKLNQLNYLIGQTNLEHAVRELFQENPKVFEVLDILLAIRKEKGAHVLNSNGVVIPITDYFQTPEKILVYLEETGLSEVFRDKSITNLVDYVFGIEVGLDTNARKNRGGENMSKAVASAFDKAGINYQTEVVSGCFPDITTLGVDIKRFDFVVKTKRKTYLIEANYYNVGGSKLNEVARAYSDVAPKINQYSGYEFVWITDGKGWMSAKNKLEEAYKIIPSLYNLVTLGRFIEKAQIEGVL